MALIYFNGFEHGDLSDAQWGGGTRAIDSTIKRTGGYSLRCNPTTTNVGFAQYAGWNTATGAIAPWNLATCYHKFYFYAATLPAANSEEICRSANNGSGASKFFIRVDSNGHLMAFASNGTTQIGSTGTATILTGNWYRIEFKVGSGLTADCEVKVDGVVDISGTGNTGSNNGYITIGKVSNRNGNTVDFYYDDVEVNDSEYPGEGSVYRLDPDGDGTYTAWTVGAGAGADWQQLDEVPQDGNTSYLISTLSIGDASTVTLETCASAGVSGTIKGVMPVFIDGRNVAGCLVKFRLRSGTTDIDTATGVTTGAAYVAFGMIFTTDPDTSAAWTTGGVDGVEIGCVEASATQKTRWTAAYLMVATVPTVAGMGQVI